MKIPLARPHFPAETLESIKKVLDSGWVTKGPKVEEFEDKYAKYNSSKYAIAVSSGTAALHVSLLALGIGKGDEVIIPDFTFPATGTAVLFTGAKPELVDIDLETFCIDPEEIKKRITSKTKAIMPVHSFGHPAKMRNIIEIAEENDIAVIEDAAPAHGAEYEGRKIGNFGVAGCFSFHPRKVITTGEGGMITTNDDIVAEKARSIRNHGMSYETNEKNNDFRLPTFKTLGYNYRMSDISAAIGIEQLRLIDKTIEKRRSLAKLYNELIIDAGIDVNIPVERSDVKHVYQSYVILLKKENLRNSLILALRNEDIGCAIGTYSLSSLPLFNGTCPNGTEAFKNSLALPMYEGLMESDVNHILDCIKKAITGE